MCKDNLGHCGCGCNSCGGETIKKTTSVEQKTTTTTTVPALVPSGYSKKSFTTSATADARPALAIREEVLEPEVEVLEQEPEREDRSIVLSDNVGMAAAGIGFAGLLLLAALREKKKKKVG